MCMLARLREAVVTRETFRINREWLWDHVIKVLEKLAKIRIAGPKKAAKDCYRHLASMDEPRRGRRALQYYTPC